MATTKAYGTSGRGKVIVFESPDGEAKVDVVFDGETVLTTFYDLDVIISVGYRVKSKRGTQFRIWATGILRDYLRRGYALDEKRLAALGIEAEQAIELLASTMEQQRLTSPEGAALLDVIRRYARTWRFLRAYDEDDLPAAPAQAGVPTSRLDIATARSGLVAMRDEMIGRGDEPGLFGQERGDALESILLTEAVAGGAEIDELEGAVQTPTAASRSARAATAASTKPMHASAYRAISSAARWRSVDSRPVMGHGPPTI